VNLGRVKIYRWLTKCELLSVTGASLFLRDRQIALIAICPGHVHQFTYKSLSVPERWR